MSIGPSVQPLPPKSLRIIGIVLACLGGLMFLSNVFSLLLISVFDFPGRMMRMMPAEAAPPFDVARMMRAMQPIAAVSAALGILLCVGGLYVRKHQRWALTLVNVLLALMIAGLWYLPGYLAPIMRQVMQSMTESAPPGFPEIEWFDTFFQVGQYFSALFWTAPIVTILYLLNRKSSRLHFQ